MKKCFRKLITISLIIVLSILNVGVVFAGGFFPVYVETYLSDATEDSITIKFVPKPREEQEFTDTYDRVLSEGGFEKLKDYFIKIEFDKEIYGLSMMSANQSGGNIEYLDINEIKEQKPFKDIDVYVQKGTNVKIIPSDDILLYSEDVEVIKRNIGIDSNDTTEENFSIKDIMQFMVNDSIDSNKYFSSYYSVNYKNVMLDWDIYNELNFTAIVENDMRIDNITHGVYEKDGTYTIDKVISALNGNDIVESTSSNENQSQSKPDVIVSKTNSAVLIDGKNTAFQSYNINGYNYFKLRDIAMALNGSGKNFEVGWDAEKGAIGITKGKAYTVVGGEMAISSSNNTNAVKSNATLYVDGVKTNLDAYTIDGNTYFQLRDIGKFIDFGVLWDSTQNAIKIDTFVGYSS